MGRDATGALLNKETRRIELSKLLKSKMLEKGYTKTFEYNWTCEGSPTGSISIKTFWSKKEKYVRLCYATTNGKTGDKTKYDYKVELLTVKSNLGKGEILYFKCPQTGKRCKILYMAYSSEIFKSRSAYLNRIYYPSQMYSKLQYPAIQSRKLEKEINKIRNQKYLRLQYKGEPTRTAKRLDAMIKKRWEAEKRNEEIFVERFYKGVNSWS